MSKLAGGLKFVHGVYYRNANQSVRTQFSYLINVKIYRTHMHIAQL